jgi:hypothetical protein
MSHLSPAEFVDAAEGVLPPARAAHLEACTACREQAAGLAGALRAAGEVDVPEPSPLYWPHLSARIREGIVWEAPRAESWWHLMGVGRLVRFASAAALAAALVMTGVMNRRVRVSPELPPAPVAFTASVDPAGPVEDSEAWQMLTSAAAETPIEDAHAAGMAVPAGAIDRAVQRMTPEELSELGQLLQIELRRSGE